MLVSIVVLGTSVVSEQNLFQSAYKSFAPWSKLQNKFQKNRADYQQTGTKENAKYDQQSSEIKPSANFNNLVFSDEFDELNFKKWRPEITAGGGGNWEFQFYNNDRRTSYVKDGNLHLSSRFSSEILGTTKEQLMSDGFSLDLWGNAPGNKCTANAFYGCQRQTFGQNIVNPMASAQLRTVDSFNFRYGKVEFRAKMPRGDFLWPAIWLLPKDHAYGGWPTSGEIDIIEARGNMDDCFGDGVQSVSSALHWGLNYTNNRQDLTHGKYTLPEGKNFNDDFHTFTLEWTPDFIRTWVDNEHMIMNVEFKQPMYDFGGYSGEPNPWAGRPNSAPFDQEYYLILNLAVGGTGGFFPDKIDSSQNPDLAARCESKQQDNKHKKPYSNKSPIASYDFLTNEDKWLPSWDMDSEQSHLIIDYIRVYNN